MSVREIGIGNRELLIEQVREVFARMTRYPREILESDASLEEDLGIDSVKLAEVLSVLGEQYGLPSDLELPPEHLETIGSIAEGLGGMLAGNGAAGSVFAPRAHASSEPVPKSLVQNRIPAGGVHAERTQTDRTPTDGALAARVLEVFAEVTRYPLEILDPEADLEEDLGIDSVKLGEILAVLAERFSLPADAAAESGPARTIAEVASEIARLLGVAAPSRLAPTTVVSGPRTFSEPSARVESAFWSPVAKPFAGKVALVSGSGHGLGKVIAGHLADLGAAVVVNSFHSRQRGIETTAEIRARGGTAHHVWGSFANPTQLDALFDEIEREIGQLDFFVSNASNGKLGRLEEITIQDWEKAFRTNVVGLHQGAMRAARLMRAQGGGRIITLSTPAANMHLENYGFMSVTKSAVEALTRTMAVELAKDGIRVNCVSAGPVYGELLDRWPDSERMIASWESGTVGGRLCDAVDVARFVAYLLSEEANMISGSVMVIDGALFHRHR